MGLSYKETGVDVQKGQKAVEEIKEVVKSTYNPNVITELGGFAGVFQLDTDNYQKPMLIASTDGVGTKLKLAFLANKHHTVGIDLVAMSVNDLITLGAEPLFFLDYLAVDKLDIEQFKAVVGGIANGCRQAGCALLGGETAEMPNFYNKGEYDMAGFCVGIVERNKIIDGSNIKKGDILIGLKSSGIHSNGYSMIRKIFFDNNGKVGQKLIERFLTPTKIYVNTIRSITKKFEIKGIANITGGGLIENIPRILPKNLYAEVEITSFETPQIFKIIQKKGNVKKSEMYKTFNMGVGMVLVINRGDKEAVLEKLKKLDETAFKIGEICSDKQGVILKG